MERCWSIVSGQPIWLEGWLESGAMVRCCLQFCRLASDPDLLPAICGKTWRCKQTSACVLPFDKQVRAEHWLCVRGSAQVLLLEQPVSAQVTCKKFILLFSHTRVVGPVTSSTMMTMSSHVEDRLMLYVCNMIVVKLSFHHCFPVQSFTISKSWIRTF